MAHHFSDSDGDVAASKLLYVLASRARKHLHLISEASRTRGDMVATSPPKLWPAVISITTGREGGAATAIAV